jgi:hypothetical protein
MLKSKVSKVSKKSTVQSPQFTVPVTLSFGMSKVYFINYIRSLIELFSGGYVTIKSGLYYNLVEYTQELINNCNISRGKGDNNDKTNVLFTNNIKTIESILKKIKSLGNELHERDNDGCVSLKKSIANAEEESIANANKESIANANKKSIANEDKKSIANKEAKLDASTYAKLLNFTIDLGTKLNDRRIRDYHI